MLDISNRLKELRKACNKSQDDVGLQLNLNKSTISAYEKGQNFPSLETLSRLADLYGVTTDFILGRGERHILDVTDLTPAQEAAIRQVLVEFRAQNNSKDEP